MTPLSHYVGTLNVLGDESRLRLCALLRDRELSVTDLVRVTGISQSRVSTHLARLREGGFVRDRREGQHAFYALAASSLPESVRTLLDDATRSSDPVLASDRKRLDELDEAQRGHFPESLAGEMERHYSPGRTWQSLALGLAALLDLGDVLDVGSGDGAAATYFAPYCRSLRCIDISPKMVLAAKARLEAFPHASAEVASVESLPYRAASFDAVLLFHTLTYAEDPATAVLECARVLRPGGRLVVLCLAPHEHQDITAPYGERHAGFSPKALRAFFVRAGLSVTFSEVACREAKKPHFQVVLAVARKQPDSAKPAAPTSGKAKTRSSKPRKSTR